MRKDFIHKEMNRSIIRLFKIALVPCEKLTTVNAHEQLDKAASDSSINFQSRLRSWRSTVKRRPAASRNRMTAETVEQFSGY
jgi:hypothetical protein